MKFKIFSLDTLKVSKRFWKTYKSAHRNCKLLDLVISDDENVVDWMRKYPEWVQDRIKRANNFKDGKIA